MITYKVGQFVEIVANNCYHGFAIGEVVEVTELNNFGTPFEARGQSGVWYLVDGDAIPVQVTKVKFMQEKPAPVKQATGKVVYAVVNKDGIMDLQEDRDYARELKAYYGGKKAGVTIIQYTPLKEIR